MPVRMASMTEFTDVLVEPYSPSYARVRFRAWLMRAACRWVRPSEPNDEDRRLAATRSLGLWKTPPEERFDRVVRVAAAAFDVPIALIALMDRDREWFRVMLRTGDSPRSIVTAILLRSTLYSSVSLSWSAIPSSMSGLRTTPMSRVSRACGFMLVIR